MSASNRPRDCGTVLITGASRGIGAAAARLAAKRGYDVAVNYVANEKAAAEVVRDVEAAGRRALAVRADIAREADILTADEIREQEGWNSRGAAAESGAR